MHHAVSQINCSQPKIYQAFVEYIYLHRSLGLFVLYFLYRASPTPEIGSEPAPKEKAKEGTSRGTAQQTAGRIADLPQIACKGIGEPSFHPPFQQVTPVGYYSS